MTMNALEIHGLTKHYPGFTLDHLDLALPTGCIMGLIGENGAGKTTAIHLILDSIPRDGGTVQVLGQDNRAGSPAVKERVGVVLDESCLPTYLNPRQIGRSLAGMYRSWDAGAYRDYLRRFDLPENKLVHQLSRGMKMKLAIAAALSHHPSLLILDEATSGLDPVVRDEILDIFLDFTREESHSILISSHILSDLEKLCDYIAYLHQGQLLLCEEKDRLLERYALMKGSRRELEALPREAVVAYRSGPYGVEALVDRERMPRGGALDRVTIEDIIVFYARGERLS